MSEWSGLLILFGLALSLLCPLFWSLHRATIPIAANKAGWVVMRRSIFDHAIGFIQIGFSVLWIFLGTAAPFYMKENSSLLSVLILALMLVLGFLFLYGFMFTYAAYVRFNEEKLDYKAGIRIISVVWNEVTKIRMGMNGPTIHTVYGNFSISNTRRGFYQLLEIARKNGVTIQDSPYLKPHNSYWPYKKKEK